MKIILIILLAVTFLHSSETKRNKDLKTLVKKLEKVVELQDTLLKSKESGSINGGENGSVNGKNNGFLSCEDPSELPSLMMKEEYKTKSTNTDNYMSKTTHPNTIEFSPTTYYLKFDSIIYDSVNGKKIDKWKKGALMTSFIKTANGWTLITGHFVNKKWKQSQRNMWIKTAQISEK